MTCDSGVVAEEEAAGGGHEAGEHDEASDSAVVLRGVGVGDWRSGKSH